MTADLTHIDTWLFDLDNTIYPAECGFMGQVESRMTEFVAKVTGLPRDAAFDLQKRYLAEHGFTLGGMMADWNVDPHEFHRQFHDLPLDCIVRDPALEAGLERLPGRRLIFTNADGPHAERVLEHMGLDHLFEDIFHVGLADYLPKPNVATFERLLSRHGIEPSGACFFEDSERNLAPAAALGMTTVLVGPHALASVAGFVHHRTATLPPFLADVRVTGEPDA